jgi:hypothetical protein
MEENGRITAAGVPESRVKVFSTRVRAGAKPEVTKLRLDLTQLNWEDVLEYALGALVIKRQGSYRKDGSVPFEDSWVVPKPGVRGTSVQMDAQAALVKGFGLEKAQALVRKFGSAEAAFEALKALLGDGPEEEEDN